MNELSRVTQLPVPCERVWERAVSPAGINYELFPFMKMTVPKALKGKTIRDVPVGEKIGRSWFLLFGILPFDYDDITIAEVEHGHRFLEKSSMFSIERWEHERIVIERNDGCEVQDHVRFTMRRSFSGMPFLEKVTSKFLQMLFAHRHNRLIKWFGKDAK